MKYIRTKDAIYDTYSKNIQLSKEKITNEIEYYYQSNAYSIPFKLNVIAQADTIEELCDCWIIILKYLNVKPYTENINCNIAHLINNEHQIYGAIWTYDSDGVPTLKTVAKMNDKGELELL